MNRKSEGGLNQLTGPKTFHLLRKGVPLLHLPSGGWTKKCRGSCARDLPPFGRTRRLTNGGSAQAVGPISRRHVIHEVRRAQSLDLIKTTRCPPQPRRPEHLADAPPM